MHRAIWVFDPTTFRGLYANPSALELWGADNLEELLQRDFSKLSPAVRTRLQSLAVATAQGGLVIERWSFYPKGRPITVQAMISSVPLEYGGSALLFEAAPIEVQDDELRAVEALRHTSSQITLFDLEGSSTFMNPAGFAAYGENGGVFVDRFKDPCHGETVLAQVLGGQVVAELGQVKTLDGDRYHYIDARHVIDPVTGQGSVLLSERDVTAQVEAERALHAAQERAEVAEAKEQFLATMSHELRTPLNSILGFAGLLARSSVNPEQASHLTRIADAGGTLLGIVNDLIDLSELDSGRLRLQLAPFDPSSLVHDTLLAFEAKAVLKGLDLELELGVDPGLRLVGDAGHLNAVLRHFIDNAVKFTNAGQVAATISSRRTDQDHMEIEINVTDTGPGLEPGAAERLFTRLAREQREIRGRAGGAGLGLAISKELIKLMGGSIGVESKLGSGSRFWLRVTMPIAEDSVVTADTEDAETARSLNVLYADDHENNRVLIKTMLESQGHSCDTANDGVEAVRAVRSGTYDLVLMDIQMPHQDGVSAAAEIRAAGGSFARMPILALTANTLSEQRQTYAAAGMNDCIAKPVNMTALLDAVTYWTGPGAQVVEVQAVQA